MPSFPRFSENMEDGMSDAKVYKKDRQAIRWPAGLPEELKVPLKLAFWVWLCTTAALLALLALVNTGAFVLL